MISEVDMKEVESAGMSGPQEDTTRAAQRAVDEFLDSGLDACRVGWREICDDFDKAKQLVNYRISHTKHVRSDKAAKDLAMRSNRAKGEIYLVHAERLGK